MLDRSETVRQYIIIKFVMLNDVKAPAWSGSNTLRHKLLGETQFKLDEAERLSTMLGLTMAERDACFFDAENRFSRSATLELPKRGKRQ